MQLVPCPNSFEINVNHQNNVLIVVMSIAAVLNLFSRPHTWEVVLRPTVADETNGGGRWSELMVVVAFVQVGGGPTHFSFGLISLEPVQPGQME
jgi:hypothetical protein